MKAYRGMDVQHHNFLVEGSGQFYADHLSTGQVAGWISDKSGRGGQAKEFLPLVKFETRSSIQ
jgi:hypothetical protein